MIYFRSRKKKYLFIRQLKCFDVIYKFEVALDVGAH